MCVVVHREKQRIAVTAFMVEIVEILHVTKNDDCKITRLLGSYRKRSNTLHIDIHELTVYQGPSHSALIRYEHLTCDRRMAASHYRAYVKAVRYGTAPAVWWEGFL